MLFPEYARKLTEAYRDMTSRSDMFTAVGEMFSIFGESERGAELFANFCIAVAGSEGGRKASFYDVTNYAFKSCVILQSFQAFRDVIAFSRNTRPWELLICDVTRRLKYQADNVIRIQVCLAQ